MIGSTASWWFILLKLDKRKLKKLDNQVKREQKTLEKEISALNTKQFACRPDAEADLERFINEHQGGLFKITGSVDLLEIPEKKPGRAVLLSTNRGSTTAVTR